jgi:hypothetical protein
MTPKEKAMQMTEKYIAPTMDRRLCGYIQSILVAKQCALIAVDELLSETEEFDGMRVINNPYWLEVKQEIEKL